jgi:hypothetical protein
MYAFTRNEGQNQSFCKDKGDDLTKLFDTEFQFDYINGTAEITEIYPVTEPVPLV